MVSISFINVLAKHLRFPLAKDVAAKAIFDFKFCMYVDARGHAVANFIEQEITMTCTHRVKPNLPHSERRAPLDSSLTLHHYRQVTSAGLSFRHHNLSGCTHDRELGAQAISCFRALACAVAC
jgi:hypothetical protein